MKKIIRVIVFAGLFFLVNACGNIPRMMKFDVVFHTTLGSRNDEIGSNIPMLKHTLENDKDFMYEKYLDIPLSVQIFRNKLYIADKYNKRVSVFNMSMNPITNMTIPNKGNDYEFEIPFQVILNKYGEIYVLASAGTNTSQDNPFQYYIYKFSLDGKFIYRIGIDGINTGPMPYPDRIDIDLFGNLYVYYQEFDNNKHSWLVDRFSPSGEANFGYSSKYVALTNKEGGKTYAGRITDIFNLKNDDRLLLYMNYYIVERKNKPVVTPDEYYNTIKIYSILQNAVIKKIFQSKKDIDGMMAITSDDVIVLYSYNEKSKAIRYRFITVSEDNISEEFHYAPDISQHYVVIKHFVDNRGNIYSIVIKENKYFVLLRWRKKIAKTSGV